jgi:hypothetical protein
MRWRVVRAETSGPHSLDVTFKDGTRKQVNLLPLLEGPVFEPLRDPEFFARARLDPVAGTVVWPNGADIAPKPCMSCLRRPRAAEGADRRTTRSNGPGLALLAQAAERERSAAPER